MEVFLLGESIKSVGVAAMLLALTRTLKDEETAKRALTEAGHKFAVTEVGGKTSYDGFHEKVNRAVIGANLNSGIIEKTVNDIHALIHATEEAKKGILASSSASLALKIAVVRDTGWLAVALFGKSSLHYMTNHERAGLGVMHI